MQDIHRTKADSADACDNLHQGKPELEASVREGDCQARGQLGHSDRALDRCASQESVEEPLQRSEQRYQNVFHTAGVGFALTEIVWDDQGNPVDYRFLDVNRVIEEILGVKASQIIGKTLLEILPNTEPYWMERFGGVAVTGESARITEYSWGLGKYFEIAAFRPTQGQVAGLVTDVTEQKQRDDALRFTQFGVDRMADSAFWMGKDGRFIFVNDAACHATGYSREELLTMTVHDIDPDFPAEVWSAHWEQVKQQGWLIVQSHHRSKDGRVFPVEISANFMEFEGVEYNCAFARDTSDREQAESERRKLEAKVQRAQNLESLGVLAGGIAHDFNNLLMAILGNAEMALLELSPMSPARESIEEAKKASLRAAELTKQMLAYSGKGHFIINTLNLSDIVQDMGHMLEATVPKQVAIRYCFGANLPTIRADLPQIKQVVMNLITNASEALDDAGGIISVTTRVMHADHRYLENTYLDDDLPEGLYAALEVADTGCGMDEEVRAKFFEPFYSTKFMGRGLGMAAVLGIIRGHRGAIRVDSQVGRGTTVTVLFPIAPATVTRPSHHCED